MADNASVYRVIERISPISERMFCKNLAGCAACHMPMTSASQELIATVCCVLLQVCITTPSSKRTPPDVDLLFPDVPQLASE
jgi:hypothetical protein